jgi:hypothetical protein
MMRSTCGATREEVVISGDLRARSLALGNFMAILEDGKFHLSKCLSNSIVRHLHIVNTI